MPLRLMISRQWLPYCAGSFHREFSNRYQQQLCEVIQTIPAEMVSEKRTTADAGYKTYCLRATVDPDEFIRNRNVSVGCRKAAVEGGKPE